MQQPDISHIVSVYNKRELVAHMARSLIEQPGDLKREFIFVDDVSTDDSVAVLKDATKNLTDVVIIQNSDNRGPSVRLNQGARVARGKYLHFLDHDDVVPAGAIAHLHTTLEQTGADFVYGKWEKTDKPIDALVGTPIQEAGAATVFADPLKEVLTGRYKRMCVMVKRETFLEAGGFDEEVFIQDESLPIRLALVAKTMAAVDAVVNLVPKVDGQLSDNKTQLNHDRFLAYYHALSANPGVAPDAAKRMIQRAVSAAWKEMRATEMLPHFRPIFFRYMLSKVSPGDVASLAPLYRYFLQKENVRRA